MSALGTLSEVNICVSQRAETKSLDLWELLPALPGFSRLLGCLLPLGSLSLGAAAGPCPRCSELVLLMRDFGKVAATENGCILPHSGLPFLPEGSAVSGGSVAEEPGELVLGCWLSVRRCNSLQ